MKSENNRTDIENNGNSSVLLNDKSRNKVKDKNIGGNTELNEFLYPSIIYNAQDAIFAKDLECKILAWNKGTERIYGYTAAEIIGKHISTLVPPERKDEPDEIIRNLKNGARIENFETTRIRKDGKEINISVTISPIKNNDGKLIGASVIARDITEKKYIEMLLKEKDSRFKQIAENIREVFYIRDIDDSHIEYVSPAYRDLWGREPEYLYQEPSSLVETIADEYRGLFLDSVKKQKRGETTRIEYLIKRPDGGLRWIKDSAFPVKDEFGSYYRIIGVAEDITKQKESELEKSSLLSTLKEQQLRMDSIISTVPGVVWEAWGKPGSSSQRVNFVNEYVEQMLGYSVDEWLSTPNFWLTIVHPEDRERAAKISLDIFTSKKSGVNRYRWVAKDGRVVWIESRSVVICDSEGKPAGMRGVSIDISESKKHEEALRNKENQHSQMLSILPAAVYTCDSMGRITYYNRRAAELWGREPKLFDNDEKFCGSYKLYNPDGSQLPHYLTPMARVLTGGEPLNDLEIIIERPDSSRIVVKVNIEPILDFKGNLIGAINVFQDITEQKNSEYMIKHLAAIVESSDDAIISKDLNGIITSWNKGAEKIFGYSEEEVIGKPVTILIPKERYEEEPMIIDRIQKGELIDHYETVRLRKDGTHIDISLTISPIKNSEGVTIGASKIVRDITSKKNAQKILRESEERFNLIANTSPVLIWFNNKDGCEFVNNAYTEFCGCSLQDLLGPGWTKFVHPDDYDNYVNSYMDAVSKRMPFNAEVRLLRNDGEWRWVLSRGVPRYTPGGDFYGYVGSSTDITDLKQTQDFLIEQKQKSEETAKQLTFLSEVSKILSSSLDYYQTLSTVANLAVPYIADWCAIDILTEEQQLERVAVVHSDPEKVQLAHDLAKLYPPDPDQQTGVINVIRTKKSEIYPEITYDLLKANTKDDYLLKILLELGLNSAITVPLISGEKVLGAISLIYAESGRRYNNNDLIIAEELAIRSGIAIENSRLYYKAQQLNDELDKRVKIRTAQLESANQELETFSYSVSHDLRAPLRHINGYIGLLQQKSNFTPESEGTYYLKKISSSAKKMSNLIDDMLAYSRIGSTKLQISRLNMQELVKEVVQGFKDQIEERNVSWYIGELPFVFGDRSMMRLVVANLVSNAVKFTGKNPDAKIEISCQSNNVESIFCIKDNGVGFDMKYVNKLFNVFQRLHKMEDFEGDGMGLANVNRIIEKHGGRTWAKGEINKGASFYFSLPEFVNETK
ncbi:MAG: PAS domain S-box protein [Ignavibacteriaceae bacterium]